MIMLLLHLEAYIYISRHIKVSIMSASLKFNGILAGLFGELDIKSVM